MCGIVGAFRLRGGAPLDRQAVVNARDGMRARGADAAGLWMDEQEIIALAHRRLAIIDLSSTATQPIPNEDRSIWLVHNGEIYNHRELRAELQDAGHRFFTDHCDSEVIVHAYEQWGQDCLTRLRGCFAFAIWDGRTRELWLARDRAGIKPLYTLQHRGQLVFASEVAALFSLTGAERRVDAQGVYHYLTFLTVPAPRTLYVGVSKMPAGCALRVTDGGRERWIRYWDAAEKLNDPVDDHLDVATARTRELVVDAIVARTQSDVPLGVTLSGGIDSSLVTAVTRRHCDDLHAVTVDYEVASEYSEGDDAAAIAAVLSVPLCVQRVTGDQVRHALRSFSDAYADYPAAAPDVALFWLLARHLRREGRPVCLLGEGADELGGYPSYLSMERERRPLELFARVPPQLKRALMLLGSARQRRYLEVARSGFVVPRRHVQSFSEGEKQALWCGPKAESSYAVLERLCDEITTTAADRFLRKVSNIELKLRLPEFMLPRVDGAMMAHGVEARVPFLDGALLDYSLRLRADVKMAGGQPKCLIRRALERELDGRLFAGPKRGFGRVLTPLLDTRLPLWFAREVLAERDHPLFAYVRRNGVEALLRDRRTVHNGNFRLFTLFALARWLETHGAGPRAVLDP